MKNNNFTCVVCPNGCELTVFYDQDNSLIIENAECARGLEWVKQEITNPKRTIASSILVENGDLPLVSVKTDAPIPLKKIFDVMFEIRAIKLIAPVKIGQIIIKNAANTGISIIATKNINCKTSQNKN